MVIWQRLRGEELTALWSRDEPRQNKAWETDYAQLQDKWEETSELYLQWQTKGMKGLEQSSSPSLPLSVTHTFVASHYSQHSSLPSHPHTHKHKFLPFSTLKMSYIWKHRMFHLVPKVFGVCVWGRKKGWQYQEHLCIKVCSRHYLYFRDKFVPRIELHLTKFASRDILIC